MPTFSRRAALAASLPLLGLTGDAPPAAKTPIPTVRVDLADPRALPFDRRDAGIVGVYDIDWLLTPGFTRLLDNLAASPGAFSGVRLFGALTAGQPELYKPESAGDIWTSPDAPPDFTLTLDALAALTSRGLTPLVVLGFFPPAVSPSPIQPPADWATWQTLVRTFLETLATDPRLGPEAIAGWRFEVWNEPNEGRFWSGTQDDYLALYRATSDAVVDTGLPVRLGGPAIAYKPQASPADGLPWIDTFLRFVAGACPEGCRRDPSLKLDFLSLHRKGTVDDDPPDPRRLYQAADEVAALALAINPIHFGACPDQRRRGLTIVNDEADEKVGFEVPYPPRMDAANAAWLAAATSIAATLTEKYRDAGLRFLMAADNANLQLVQAPFDGRRSIMTLAKPHATDTTSSLTPGRSGAPPWAPSLGPPPTGRSGAPEPALSDVVGWAPSPRRHDAGRSAGPALEPALERSEWWPASPHGAPLTASDAPAASATDLLKLPAYALYEMLRLLGDRQLPITAGSEHLFPATALYHLATAADTHVGILLTHYPDPANNEPTPQTIDYVASGLPWPTVNVALFQIDARTSNAYTAAGGGSDNPHPVPSPTDLPSIRQAQELALARPIARDVATSDGLYRETLTLDPYATICLWITPTSDASLAAPVWLTADPDGDNVLLRWEPTTDPAFYTYELYSSMEEAHAENLLPTNLLTPDPLRAALWVDTAPPPGRRYAVRTLTASGIASRLVRATVSGPRGQEPSVPPA